MTLAELFRTKGFVLVAEMETPKGVDISDFVQNARRLKGRVDAALVPDMGYAVMRLAALAGALLIKEQGLAPIVQFNCRDRNRLALQGDLLAAHVLGLENVMAVHGRPVEMGDHLAAKGVWDLDVPGFLTAVKCLAEGRDLGGRELKGCPRFCLGARLEPWGEPGEARLRLAEAARAVEKGAAFLVTPPVFDLAAFARTMEELEGLKVPVLGSVLLLKSVGMARYLNQNLPGVAIGEETIRRIRLAGDRAHECVKLAGETVRGLKGLCQGALLVTMGWEDKLAAILDEAGL